MVGTTCAAMQHHSTEDQNNQLHRFENLKNTQQNINMDFKSTESSWETNILNTSYSLLTQ